MVIRAIWGMVLVLLAACGGGSGGANYGGDIAVTPVPPPPVPPDPRLARLDGYEAQKNAVFGMAPLAADLPLRGTASFNGFASLRVEGAQPLVLSGDAWLYVDFASQQAGGAMERVFGTNPGGGVADYAGSVRITGGQVQRDLQLDYAGALSGAGQNITVSGRMAGQFLGDPLRGVTAADLEAQVVQNGQSRTGTMVIVAQTPGVVVPPTPDPP